MAVQPGQPQRNPALGMIQQILTNPRPPAAPPNAAQPQGQVIGGGIAGVASTMERSGIKIYNERDKYNEWEFLYDMTQDRTGLAGAAGQPGQPGQGQQRPGAQPGGPAGPPVPPPGPR